MATRHYVNHFGGRLHAIKLPPHHCGQPMKSGALRTGLTQERAYNCTCGATAWVDSFGRSISWSIPAISGHELPPAYRNRECHGCDQIDDLVNGPDNLLLCADCYDQEMNIVP